MVLLPLPWPRRDVSGAVGAEVSASRGHRVAVVAGPRERRALVSSCCLLCHVIAASTFPSMFFLLHVVDLLSSGRRRSSFFCTVRRDSSRRRPSLSPCQRGGEKKAPILYESAPPQKASSFGSVRLVSEKKTSRGRHAEDVARRDGISRVASGVPSPGGRLWRRLRRYSGPRRGGGGEGSGCASCPGRVRRC